MDEPALSILIVNWNTRTFLQQCLATLPFDERAVEVFVVDNASRDGSAEMVREMFPQVQLIASDKNLGFAAGNNLAARQARGQYLLLLNPDTIVPRGTLTALIEFANAHPQCGALGPELQNADGSRQRSCWRGTPDLKMALSDALYLWRVPLLGAWFGSEYRPEELRAARTVDHLIGACLMIRHEAWNETGALDEGFFLFLEETDWCARARRAGWELYYVPDVHVTHFGQESMRLEPSRNVPQFYRSYLKFYRARHSSQLRVAVLKAIIALGSGIRIGMWWLRELRAHALPDKEQAHKMRNGYQQTVRELGSF